jgi:hypothetical protein
MLEYKSTSAWLKYEGTVELPPMPTSRFVACQKNKTEFQEPMFELNITFVTKKVVLIWNVTPVQSNIFVPTF